MRTNRKMNEDAIAKLQYQLNRYRAMRKGAACQTILAKIHKLQAQYEG